MNAAAYYDDFLSAQVKSGINDRIYQLYQRLKKIGLHRNEAILEIGCGIGAFTYLLAKKMRGGIIEAFDPSPKSIQFAKDKIRKPTVQFYTGEILSYQPQTAALFDKILLFDVLEHIPEQDHLQVFYKIAGLLKPDGLLLINLPNPAYILYDQAHNPGGLQELDQPVFLRNLLPKLEAANLSLDFFESYSVWVKQDYHFLLVRKQAEFREVLLQEQRTFSQKATVWLRRFSRKLLHPFP